MTARLLLPVIVLCLCAWTGHPRAQDVNTVGDLIAQAYHVPNAVIKHKTVSCGTTATNATLNDGSRFADIFANQGANNCSLMHSNQVTVTTGYPLTVGGILVENWRDDMVLPTQEMWCICNTAATTIDVTELLLP